ELGKNSHLPGFNSTWTQWTRTDLNPSGQQLYDTEVIYDSQGIPATQRVLKFTSSGEPADKITYRLPSPEEHVLDGIPPTNGSAMAAFPPGWNGDASQADFLYLYSRNVAPQNIQLQLSDSRGRTVSVQSQAATNPSTVMYWPSEWGRVQWTPNEVLP